MYELDRRGYLARVLRTNPWELVRLVRTVLTTMKYRLLLRCAGKGTIIGLGTEIINSANVRIGRRCLLQDRVYIRAGAEGRVVIGDGVAINSFCRLFGHGGIRIGADTQIGPGTLVTTTDHDYRAGLATCFKPVTVGAAVWIGANVTILPGVSIGDGSVVGAGSVVTKSLPAGSVAVGVPARVVREIGTGPSGAAANR